MANKEPLIDLHISTDDGKSYRTVSINPDHALKPSHYAEYLGGDKEKGAMFKLTDGLSGAILKYPYEDWMSELKEGEKMEYKIDKAPPEVTPG